MAREIAHEGPTHRELVAFATKAKSARGYLEVGVCDGGTLSQIACPSIGVDPYFILSHNVAANKKIVHLYQMTSDDFFKQYDPRELLRCPIDVTFLDGLHQFEYLLRDYMNAEAISHKDGLIILDDCLPLNVEMTERTHNIEQRKNQERAMWWTGDVWKLLPILRKYRPDLQITCIDAQPTGSVCITNLDSKSNNLRDSYTTIVREYLTKQLTEQNFDEFYASFPLISGFEVMRGFEASLYLGP